MSVLRKDAPVFSPRTPPPRPPAPMPQMPRPPPPRPPAPAPASFLQAPCPCPPAPMPRPAPPQFAHVAPMPTNFMGAFRPGPDHASGLTAPSSNIAHEGAPANGGHLRSRPSPLFQAPSGFTPQDTPNAPGNGSPHLRQQGAPLRSGGRGGRGGRGTHRGFRGGRGGCGHVEQGSRYRPAGMPSKLDDEVETDDLVRSGTTAHAADIDPTSTRLSETMRTTSKAMSNLVVKDAAATEDMLTAAGPSQIEEPPDRAAAGSAPLATTASPLVPSEEGEITPAHGASDQAGEAGEGTAIRPSSSVAPSWAGRVKQTTSDAHTTAKGGPKASGMPQMDLQDDFPQLGAGNARVKARDKPTDATATPRLATTALQKALGASKASTMTAATTAIQSSKGPASIQNTRNVTKGDAGVESVTEAEAMATADASERRFSQMSLEEMYDVRLLRVERSTACRPPETFEMLENVKGRRMNTLSGLALFREVLTPAEQVQTLAYARRLAELGDDGALCGRTYSAPRRWMRGKGRVTVQMGCCYNYARDQKGNPPGIIPSEVVCGMPPLFEDIIDRMIGRGIFDARTRPNSCIVNFYTEGDCIPPHIDHHDFTRPFVTLSLLSEQPILFGEKIGIVNDGEFSAPFSLPLPLGSVLVLDGNGANVAKHCVPAVCSDRVSITFRKIGPKIKMDPYKGPHGQSKTK